MQYLIHTCPQRMWYVTDFLIPSMEAQGISDIVIWNDENGEGNLHSCMQSFLDCGKRDGGTWHLQDDVIICRDFAERTQDASGVVCGFACNNFGPSMAEHGSVPVIFMWYSFQCLHLPNALAAECAEWFYKDANNRPHYKDQISTGKNDDWFFREFMLERHKDMKVTNLKPNLVDHIDYLIGGTLINKNRAITVNRAQFFPDDDLVDELEQRLKTR